MASVPPLQQAMDAINPPSSADFSRPWTFSIAGFELSKWEVPEGFELGSKAKITTHEFINPRGKTVTRTNFQGAYPVPTKWTAHFAKATALYRAQALHKLMLDGTPCEFVYGPMKFKVQIEKFVYTPKWQTEVEYSIELIVLEDLNGGTTQGLPESFDAGMETLYVDGTAQFLTLYSQDTDMQTFDQQNSDAALASQLAAIRGT